MTITGSARLLEALEALCVRLDTLPLPLDAPSAHDARRDRDALVHQLDDYLLPRVRSLDAPLLAVVGGSTGAGKSTLVNAIVGARVSEPGVLRPTTRAPVLAHHTADGAWFTGDRVLPGLPRVTGAGSADPGTLRLVGVDSLAEGLALLDAPDVDSVVTANRELAHQLLAAADLWLFVTTAARYADAVPWDLLREAASRSAAVAVVLDRVAPEDADEVSRDLARLLAGERLGDSPLFVVPESRLVDGELPPDAARPLREWLHRLATDAQARQDVVRRTLDGALRQLHARIEPLALAAEDQARTVDALAGAVGSAYASALSGVDAASRDGSLLRGEVLARWQEFVGTGELMRSFEERLGRFRDRVSAMILGRPQPAPAQEVGVAIEHGVEALVRDAAHTAAEQAGRSWSGDPAGRALLARAPSDLTRASPQLPERAAAAVRAWQGGVLDMIRSEAGGKRSTARFLSFGINGLAVTLMVVVFAHTAGLTGAEVGIAAGTAVVGQRLLEAVFGDDAVREMADRARMDLATRVGELLELEQERYRSLLEASGVDRGAAAALRAGAADVAASRTGTSA